MKEASCGLVGAMMCPLSVHMVAASSLGHSSYQIWRNVSTGLHSTLLWCGGASVAWLVPLFVGGWFRE